MIFYEIISTVIFVLLMPFYTVIRFLNGKKLYGWREKLGFLKVPDLGDKVIMFHGVSVGETIALENLVKRAKAEFSDYKIVVTTGTKTGQDIAQKKYKAVADFVTYFPFDVPFAVNSFLDKVNPSAVLIAETELWPVFSSQCQKRGIKLYCINGRMSDSTFKSYRIFKMFFKTVLGRYTKVLTQSEIDREKLIAVGSSPERTAVMKNLKFDIKKSDDPFDLSNGGFRVIIAGSTHKGEDEIVLDVFKEKLQKFNDIKLLLVPRHLQRLPQIKDILDKTGLRYGYRSKGQTFNDCDVLLLDTMGELSKSYAICHFAFIGGSFNKTGGHNPLEATVWGKPAVTGPHIHNFRDIYWLLSQSDAGKVVKNQKELSDCFEKFLSDDYFYQKACKDCGTIFNDQQGALDCVIDELKQVL